MGPAWKLLPLHGATNPARLAGDLALPSRARTPRPRFRPLIGPCGPPEPSPSTPSATTNPSRRARTAPPCRHATPPRPHRSAAPLLPRAATRAPPQGQKHRRPRLLPSTLGHTRGFLAGASPSRHAAALPWICPCTAVLPPLRLPGPSRRGNEPPHAQLPLSFPLHRARWLTGVARPASPPHRASAVPWPCSKPIDRFSVPRPCSWTKPDPEPWPGTRLRVTPAERRRGALLRRCSAAAPRALCSWAVRSRSDGPKQTSPESKEPRKRSAPSFFAKESLLSFKINPHSLVVQK